MTFKPVKIQQLLRKDKSLCKRFKWNKKASLYFYRGGERQQYAPTSRGTLLIWKLRWRLFSFFQSWVHQYCCWEASFGSFRVKNEQKTFCLCSHMQHTPVKSGISSFSASVNEIMCGPKPEPQTRKNFAK